MELVHGAHQTSRFAPEDVINIMPKNVITNILDCLPVQDAVRTSILSRNWRYKWTKLSKLVFDRKFIEFVTKGRNSFDVQLISRLLLHIKGPITKFVIYISTRYKIFGVVDLIHWVKFLSKKGIKEFTLINTLKTPLELPSHLFSCLELKHLKLRHCCLRHTSSFCGFPNLLTLDLNTVILQNCKYEEFITSCPLLEILKINHPIPTGKVKPAEIAKLENLKRLQLSLCELGNMANTSSGIFQLVGLLPKLRTLGLDFQNSKLLVDAAGGNRTSSALHGLKSLELGNLDFNSRPMVLFAFDLIHGSLNLQTLKIMAAHENRVSPPPLTSWEVECGIMGSLQKLRNVKLGCIKDSEIELCFIKSLLAYCSLLKKMVIYNHITTPNVSAISAHFAFARKLLMLPHACEIIFPSLPHA